MLRIIIKRVPGSKMAHKNTKLTGPANIMMEKHGEISLEGLKHWQKRGFPQMGSFCLVELKKLENALLKSERKKKRCWYAFRLWEKEAEIMQMNEEVQASRGSVGHFNLSVSQKTDADLDLDFPRHVNAPPLLSSQPPAYAPAAAAAAAAAASRHQHTDQGETKPILAGTRSQTLMQQSARLAHPTMNQPRPLGNTSYGDNGLFPMIQVMNPQDGNPAYVFRAWRPSDIKDVVEFLPDPSVAGVQRSPRRSLRWFSNTDHPSQK